MYARDLVGFSPLVPCVFSFAFCGSFAPFSVALSFRLASLLHFLMDAARIFVWHYVSKGCGVLPILSVLFEEFHFLLGYFFLFKVL